MAVFTPSALISEIRGSVGDQTFSRNAEGPVVKAKLIQTVRNTSKQLTWRGNLSEIVLGWQTLTDDDRRQWDLYARENPLPNSLGVTRCISGYQLFCKLNMNRQRAGQPVLSRPVQRGPLPTILTTFVNADPFPYTQWITHTPNTAGNSVVRYITRGMSPGVSKPSMSKFRLYSAGAWPFSDRWSVETMYNNTFFPDTLASEAGKRIFLMIAAVHLPSGWENPPMITNFIV